MTSAQKPKFLKPDDDTYASERDVQPTDDQVTTFVFNAHHSLAIDAQRERLPIKKYRDQILYCLENFQTLILVGETGCGKSTQVPQMLANNIPRFNIQLNLEDKLITYHLAEEATSQITYEN